METVSSPTQPDRVRTDTIEEALDALRAGLPVVVLDDPRRENEGDIIMAAQHCTPEWMGVFVRYGSGYVCTPMTAERADALDLPFMVERNEDSMGTAFTVTTDARTGITTGISAQDRSLTVQLLADPSCRPTDLVRPGHILPLRAKPGGVLERPGHTEACVDLLALAGLTTVGVIVELVEDDGSMRRADSCRVLADELNLPLVTIEALRTHLEHATARSREREAGGGADVVHHPLADPPNPAHVSGVEMIGRAHLPTQWGDFVSTSFRDSTGVEHLGLTPAGWTPSADAAQAEPVLVRVHSECLTGDVFTSRRCDCGPQLHESMRRVAQAGAGAVVYLRGHEGRGIGIAAKIAAYALQDAGRDTVDANVELGFPVDGRDYAVAADILRALGVDTIALLTNNPDKTATLRAHGITVARREPLVVDAGPQAATYLATKRNRMGHSL